MRYKYNILTGQVTELAKKYTDLQEEYVKLKHEKDRQNYRDIIDNILGKYTNNDWVYESYIVDYHYWTESKEISFRPQFFIALENEGLCISEMSIEDDEIHIYIRRL